MNFEQLRLQMMMRDLYDRRGAMDAEILIADAFAREMARHDKIQQQRALERKKLTAVTPSNCV
jgi:hypothetical protein